MTIAIVQSAVGGTTTWSTGLSVTAGNYLVIVHAGQSPNGGGTSSIVDSLSTPYTLLGNALVAGYAGRTAEVYMWGGFISSSGALTVMQSGTFGVTLSPGDAAGGPLYAIELSGVWPTTPANVVVINQVGSANCNTQFSAIGNYFMLGAGAQVYYNVGSWNTQYLTTHTIQTVSASSIVGYEDSATDSLSFYNTAGGPTCGVSVQLNPVPSFPTPDTTEEHYVNQFSCKVGAGGIDATSGTLPVTAVALASSGFQILVGSERMLVTAGGTTTNWTVVRGVEGSFASSHVEGAFVSSILTVAALDQLREDRFQTGSSFPTYPKAGDLFFLNNSTSATQYRYNGTKWQSLLDLDMVSPASYLSLPTAWDDDFSNAPLHPKWRLFDPHGLRSNVAHSMSNSWFSMNFWNSAISDRIFGYMQPLPVNSAWKFRSKMCIDCATGNYFGTGLFVYNGLNRASVLGINTAFGNGVNPAPLYIERASNGSYAGQTGCYYNANFGPYYLEVEYDGYTNINYRYSTTGAFFTTFFTEVLSTILIGPPTHIGIGIYPYGDGSVNPKIGMCGSFDWFRRII